jgi:homoserine kinase
MTQVQAFAPATVANIGVGFDVLGLALDEPGDFVTVEVIDTPGVVVEDITGDGGRLPYDPDKNTAAIAAAEVLKIAGSSAGLRLWLDKGLPLASGMGSSAASAVAAAVATNAALGEPLHREDLLPAVLASEEAVSGRHADNVAPALLGGIVLITGLHISEIHRLPVPKNVFFSLVTPHVEVPTAEARAVLPRTVPLAVMVHQTGAVAQIVHALHEGNVQLLAHAMKRDSVVEPARKHLIPHLGEARKVAARAGALATVISGAGPSLCSLCITAQDAEMVTRDMVVYYERAEVGASGITAIASQRGAYVVDG